MFFLYQLVISLLEDTFSLIQRKVSMCPNNTKVWALLPLIVYMCPLFGLETTFFTFTFLSIIFFKQVKGSILTIEKEWKFKNMEICLLPFAIPAMVLMSLGMIRWEDV